MFATKKKPAADAPATPALPAGYDDPNDPWFIEPELREYYKRPTRADIRKHNKGLHQDAMADRYASIMIKLELGPAPTPPPALTRVRHYDGPASRPELAEIEEYTTAREHRDARLEQLADEFDHEAEAWLYHLDKSLPDARRAKETADRAAALHAQWEREHRCDACSQVEPTTRPLAINPAAGTVGTGPGPLRKLLCTRCAAHLEQALADDTVNGRPRERVVREWYHSLQLRGPDALG